MNERSMSRYGGRERRRYIRIGSRISVQFRLLSLDKKRFLSDWLLGHTKDIGKGGICLTASNLGAEYAKLINDHQVKLELDLEMPLIHKSVKAFARVIWAKSDPDVANKYSAGLMFDEESQKKRDSIVFAAFLKKYLLVIVFVTGILILSFIVQLLTR